jgi:hypothetical protein
MKRLSKVLSVTKRNNEEEEGIGINEVYSRKIQIH